LTTKYHRYQERPEAPEPRRTPFMRQGPPMRRMSRRQATFVIVVFLLSAVLLSQLAIRRTRSDPFALQPAIRGEGTIVETERGPEGQGLVRLEIAVEGGASLSASWEIPDPYWALLSTGDRVAVVYQLSHVPTALRILECGIVALPDEIR
jgi:hypothetical protein